MEEHWKSLQTTHCMRQKYPQPPFRSWCFCREWLGAGRAWSSLWNGMGEGMGWILASREEWGDWGHQSKDTPRATLCVSISTFQWGSTKHRPERTFPSQKSLPSPHGMPQLSASPRHHLLGQLQQDEQEPSTATALIPPNPNIQ